MKILRKRYADRHKKKAEKSNLIFLVKEFKDDNFKGDICYYNFKNSNIKVKIQGEKVIIDNNFKLLEFYDYNSKVKLSAFYNDKNEIIEWYFDIAREINKENGIPYEDDMFLDVVVRPDGEIIVLDEDELQEALNKKIITDKEYQEAIIEKDLLLKKLKFKKEELKNFTDRYLNFYENNEV